MGHSAWPDGRARAVPVQVGEQRASPLHLCRLGQVTQSGPCAASWAYAKCGQHLGRRQQVLSHSRWVERVRGVSPRRAGTTRRSRPRGVQALDGSPRPRSESGTAVHAVQTVQAIHTLFRFIDSVVKEYETRGRDGRIGRIRVGAPLHSGCGARELQEVAPPLTNLRHFPARFCEWRGGGVAAGAWGGLGWRGWGWSSFVHSEPDRGSCPRDLG